MNGKQSTKWFWSSWSGDLAVRSLTPAERGLWIDLLALAANGNPTGYVVDDRGTPLAVEQIARFANCSAAEAESLIDGILQKGVASRDRTGRLLNRRMVRDLELSVKRRRAGKAGGTTTAMKWHHFSGLPQHLPEQVPRQSQRALLKKERIKKTFSGTARESAREGARARENGSADETPPAPQQSGSATEASKGSAISPTDDLATVIQKKGWVQR